MEKRIYKCCLCGREYEGYGNDPWPISLGKNDRCCNKCNMTKVIPARIELIDMKNRRDAKTNKEAE